MLKLRLMNVNMISLAKIIAIVYGLFGLIMGCFVAVSKMLGIQATGEMAQLQNFGVGAIVILPVIYCIIGAISGLVSAFFFNTAIKWVGPLELNVAERA